MWFNDELMNLKQDKRKAERRLKKYFQKENRKKFCIIRNKNNFKLKETWYQYCYYTDNLPRILKAQVRNYHLRNLQHIENCTPLKMKVMLLSNLIPNTLDYCNAVRPSMRNCQR